MISTLIFMGRNKNVLGAGWSNFGSQEKTENDISVLNRIWRNVVLKAWEQSWPFSLFTWMRKSGVKLYYSGSEEIYSMPINSAIIFWRFLLHLCICRKLSSISFQVHICDCSLKWLFWTETQFITRRSGWEAAIATETGTLIFPFEEALCLCILEGINYDGRFQFVFFETFVLASFHCGQWIVWSVKFKLCLEAAQLTKRRLLFSSVLATAAGPMS